MTSPLDTILSKLEHVKEEPYGSGKYMARCPAHADGKNSLSLTTGTDGSVLLNCFAGCGAEVIMHEIGLELKDLYEQPGDNNKKGGRGRSIPPRNTATAQHFDECNSCTLEQYARAKALPLDFLRGLGLSDFSYLGAPAVRIPHRDTGGAMKAMLFRTALKKSEDGDNRVRWKSGNKATLYGLDRLQAARKAGYITIVEGQSDCQTLWYHGEPAIGLPGAGTWQEVELSECLKDIPIIYIVKEPDQGGQAILKHLATSSLRTRARIIRLSGAGAKDPSELHISGKDAFKPAWTAALQGARPWTELDEEQSRAEQDAAWKLCADLARQPDILACAAEELDRQGLVGETRALLSRSEDHVEKWCRSATGLPAGSSAWSRPGDSRKPGMVRTGVSPRGGERPRTKRNLYFKRSGWWDHFGAYEAKIASKLVRKKS